MVVPRQSIKDDWWWTFWTGTDYGFSGSTAFSVLSRQRAALSTRSTIFIYSDVPSNRNCPPRVFANELKSLASACRHRPTES
jgi:hypothetical protein